MKIHVTLSFFLASAAALVVSLGCSSGSQGPATIKVTGKIHNNGKPLPMNPAMYEARAAKVELQFANDGKADDFSETALADPNGKFEVRLPVGKYRVGVAHYPDGTTDQLGGKFEVRKSPLKCEITPTTTEIELDLAKPAKS